MDSRFFSHLLHSGTQSSQGDRKQDSGVRNHESAEIQDQSLRFDQKVPTDGRENQRLI